MENLRNIGIERERIRSAIIETSSALERLAKNNKEESKPEPKRPSIISFLQHIQILDK